MFSLGSVALEIKDALERMNAKPNSLRPFVVITAKHEKRERFIQFYGSVEKGINLDLPIGQFNPSERARLAIERIFGVLDHVLYETEYGYGFKGCAAAQGAVWTVAILEAIGFPSNASVVIEEHADGTGVA